MAFGLGQLYERDGSQGLLTQGTYTAFGGVKEAIARRADEVFEAFAADHEQADQVLHAVFSELIKIDEQGIVTRQRAPLARLQKVPGRLHWLTA